MKKKAKIAICWCIIFLAFVSTGFAQQDTLTVMSYNIYHAEDSQDAGKSTVQEIADLIIDIAPDFVSLQEVDSRTNRLAILHNGHSFSLADSLAQLTAMTSYFGKALDFDGGGYGVAILSRESFEFKKIKLPNPQEGESRILLYVNAQLDSGASLFFAATHLDHQHDSNRLTQVEAINQRFAELEKPIILAGDFNFVPGTKEYKKMDARWIDVAQYVNDLDSTYPTENPEKRIDYIWLSKNVDWEVINYQVYDVDYSDHLPVVAKVVVH